MLECKKHRERVKEVLFTEFLQLRNAGVLIPVAKKDLTKEQIEVALRVILVIKEKRDDTLKDRACASRTP